MKFFLNLITAVFLICSTVAHAAEDMTALQNAAEQGDVRAMYKLGLEYMYGKGTKNYALAIKWLQKAADKGNTEAMKGLGMLYHDGHGVPQDYALAVKLVRTAAETEGDLPFGGHNITLGMLKAFEDELAKQQDPEEQKRVINLKKAAEHGDAHAQTLIADMYSLGNGGMLQDGAIALKWYKKAAEHGDAHAQFSLGYTFENDFDDYALAMKWYKKAAEHGNARAMTNIGNLYRNGYGVLQDDAIAAQWFQKAAELGDAEAKSKLRAPPRRR